MANRSTGRQNTGKNSSRGTSRGAQGKPSARGGASKNNKDFKGTGRPGAPGRSQKPSVKSGANKSDAKKFKPKKGQAGKIFARERGEYRPDHEYKGPHRPRRPRAEPADRLDVYDRDGVRLQKLMAQAGVASRRVCEMMISEGRVMVDDEVVTELGVRVDPSKAHIQVDGVTIQTDDSKVYYAFNKPEGVIATMEDPEGRSCISDYLNPQRKERIFHVGRLDVATEGLLLLTNDGELANRLTHPSYEVPKKYLVQVRGPMENGVGLEMKKGIRLEDGVARVDEFRLVDSTPGHLLVEVTIHSGKNRIVRRLFDAVGHPVEKLVRTEMGPVRIGSQKQGTVRNLSKVEIGALLSSVGL
ncbi:pseudouridine synthase [Kocuria koreensis]|jgi:23S rRNA pseudouridine2605 synthase|uniref:Pseudouridine synthase n=1 Tax=Rothia koreensis TaxID=592378 RepID=A0A7K1LHK9_9MICC|nr:pseudouridine synthase [Rothia koreensis]MUN54590.1 pseudouridine synthase [Rothia koreensis]